MDKDGNELDGEGTRPQKHAKSPELARDFLLDAATVIFKEQVKFLDSFGRGTMDGPMIPWLGLANMPNLYRILIRSLQLLG